ncbi:MAG: metallophosphoesterase [Candidatus Sifarchaeia archaeon]
MRIGVISDSHDNLDAIKRAVAYFAKETELIIHAGDVVAPFSAKIFKEANIPVYGVLGNNDGELLTIEVFNKLGGNVKRQFNAFEINGRHIAVMHGEMAEVIEALIRSKMYDIVITGHTHDPKIEKIEGVLHVNPGENCGYLTGKSTIAVIDTATLTAEIIEV